MSGHHHSPSTPSPSTPGSPSSAAAAHRKSLRLVFVMVAGFMLVELATGLIAGSLALVSDAGHMATDALGVGMALAAIAAASRSTTDPSTTFGRYRWEVLAALANALLLLGVCVWVTIEAISRLREPQTMAAVPVLVVAGIGLIINIVSFRLLHAGAKESLNVRGALMEVLADMLGSVGVLVAAGVTLITGWTYADPVVALALAAFIAPRAISLGKDALRIITQRAPKDVDVPHVTAALAALDSVTEVHDVHVWTLTSGMHVASVHLVSDLAEPAPVLRAAQAVLNSHGLDHATVQIEGLGEPCHAQW